MIDLPGITIRRYRRSDFEPAARLVRDVFARFIAPDASSEGAAFWSGCLRLARANREKLEARYRQETIAFVAVDGETIVGLVMGTTNELKRLFVRARYHGRGIGRELMRRYERQCLRQGRRGVKFRVRASLQAVGFYTRMGCKRTTGIRNFHGLKIQPMSKVLSQRCPDGG